MGYRSSVVIAVHKEAYTQSTLLTNDLPALLRETAPTAHKDAMYWRLEDIKWYNDYPQISEVEDYFNTLDDLPMTADRKAQYGAIRIGEEQDDIEQWGSPYDFDIQVSVAIDCPV